jgi:heavy metal translocating P-type ATPase
MLPGIEYLPAVLGTVVFLYGGFVFLRGARGELADRKPGMMTLISLAILVAFVTSWAGTLGWIDVEIWWELATLITIMLLGHWLEMRSIAHARGALAALAELLPDTAERVTDTGLEEVRIAELRDGDIVLIRPGARIPADGVIVEGSADVDESLITGESRPVAKDVGDDVVAGTVAAGGSLRARVTATGESTALSAIMRMVAAAQASGSRAQALADRAAAILFYVALASGLVTLVAWWMLGDLEGALVRTATVLVIACPHALGLAIPLVIAISTSLGARTGLLVKDRLALERARTLDMVIFDKTGTLTKGEPVLVAATDERALALAAAVDADSEHPLARAIVAGARSRGVDAPPASGFESLAGRGAQAEIGGHRVAVGGPRLLAELGLKPLPATEAWDREGRTVLHVIEAGRIVGAVAAEDEIRPESSEAVEALHALGVRVAMITGATGEQLGGTIVWRRGCEVGMRFDEPIDVLPILARNLASQPGERRRMPRVELSCRAVIQSGTRSGLARIRDIAQGGVKIEAPFVLTPDEKVTVTAEGLRPIEGVVRWANGNLAGIAFDPEIEWQELMPWLRARRATHPLEPAAPAMTPLGAAPVAGDPPPAAQQSVQLNLPARVREGTRRWTIDVASLTARSVEFDCYAALRLGTLLWIVLPGLEGWPARIVAVDGYRFTCEFPQPLHPAVLERILATAKGADSP